MQVVARAMIVMAGVVLLSFVMTRAVPGDPAAMLGAAPGLGPDALAALRAAEGLDQPLVLQFLHYLGNLLQGDLGLSVSTGRPVAQELAARLPASVELALAGFFTALVVVLLVGRAAAHRPGGAIDLVGRWLGAVGAALPLFVSGLLLILVLYSGLGIVPEPSGRLDPWLTAPPRVTGMITIDALLAGDAKALGSALAHLVAPAGAMALFAVAPMLRVYRAALLAALQGPGVQGAQAIGLPRAVVIRHYAMPEALAALLPVAVMMLGYMLGANILVEKVFSWPGAGRWALESLAALDHAPVQGLMLCLAAIHVCLSALATQIGRRLDPRLAGRDV